jgi:hypothetical protein
MREVNPLHTGQRLPTVPEVRLSAGWQCWAKGQNAVRIENTCEVWVEVERVSSGVEIS